jgi:hypothetical protein
MRCYRTGPCEISIATDVKNAVWIITQMNILSEHYLLAEEPALAKKCQELAATVEQALKRNHEWHGVKADD